MSDSEDRQLLGLHPRGEVGDAICSVCQRSIALTRTGQVRVHGPFGNRCPGSRSLPAVPLPSLATSAPGLSSTTREDHPNLQSLRATPAPLCPPPPSSMKIIERILRASRDVAAKKLASLVEAVL